MMALSPPVLALLSQNLDSLEDLSPTESDAVSRGGTTPVAPATSYTPIAAGRT